MDWERLLCKAEYSMGERFRKTNGEESRQVSFTNLAAGSLVRFGGIVVNAGLKEDVLCQPEVAEYLLDELSSTTEEITYFGKEIPVTVLCDRQKRRLAVYKDGFPPLFYLVVLH
ncbi:uncharacterized protein LOC135480582 isoform X2 [Liolophura sinensis]|uniref:uncharacterized protein LOC135480582 isoform X2 n=1 Tax=Liolophura sinensis TaxID=3198878 RepID=UPI003158299F